MNSFEALGILGFDFIEFAVQDIDKAAEPFLKLGFEKSASRDIPRRKLKSHLLTQNGIAFIVSESVATDDPIYRFIADHGEGISNIAFLVKDAISALEVASDRGAYVLKTPRKYTKDYGAIEVGTIRAFGDVRHTFISRSGTLFHEGFELAFRPLNRGYGLEQVNHFNTALSKGTAASWVAFYEKILGLVSKPAPEGVFHIESPDQLIKMTASENPSYVDSQHGEGVDSIVLESRELRSTLALLNQEKIEMKDAKISTLGGSVLKIIETTPVGDAKRP